MNNAVEDERWREYPCNTEDAGLRAFGYDKMVKEDEKDEEGNRYADPLARRAPIRRWASTDLGTHTTILLHTNGNIEGA